MTKIQEIKSKISQGAKQAYQWLNSNAGAIGLAGILIGTIAVIKNATKK